MVCPSGGIGRHAGLRNQCLWREGSSPFSGTIVKKMAKDVNIVVLCNEIYNGLKAKGCGMTPIADSEGSFNGEFVNIVFDALAEAKK